LGFSAFLLGALFSSACRILFALFSVDSSHGGKSSRANFFLEFASETTSGKALVKGNEEEK
jgi:hypothetical protein